MSAVLATRRQALWERLTRASLDVLITGGGIVGSGIARDAAMRGLKTGLVEQRDFAFGTSSRSSRLLHGGIRYLAQGRVGLVREASVEKGILHRIAPHLASPLAFIFPSYPGTGWPLWQLRIGVRIYDWLCAGENLGKSRSLSAAQAMAALPQLNGARLRGAVRYFDGFTNDARLVLDTLRSAATAGGAVLNYCRLENAVWRGTEWECQLKDELTGETRPVRARVVVNATGPWSHRLPHSSIQLRLTKGVHLVIDRRRLPTNDAVVLTSGNRILFVIPWGERAILGTTDTDYDGSLEEIRATARDRDYILEIVNHFFPAARLAPGDVISAWAGVRPLIANPHGAASDISRVHEIHNPEPGWWDVAGGKLTTYRLIAEQTVDKIAAEQGWKKADCATADRPLVSAAETDALSGVLPPPFSQDAVRHYCANEWAAHLEDVMIRRASWHTYFADAEAKAKQVAAWMGDALEWTPQEQARELECYTGLLRRSVAF